MWYHIFKFELQYRIKRVDTYVFFIVLFLFSIVGIDFITQGIDLGPVKKNAPVVIAKTMGAITGIFMILTSMIMGVSVLRDFEYQIESLMFVNPISKKDYLIGRFLGSFAVLFFIFSGVFFGMILGEFMPWHKAEDVLDFNMWSYLNPFLTITLPILFFGACLFFVTGALTKKLVVVYTQGIILFVVFMLTKAISNDFWQAVLDPFSLTSITYTTESWSVVEKNTNHIPFIDALLYNKLFWICLGISILLLGYKKFNFNIVKRKRFKSKKLEEIASTSKYTKDVVIPNFQIETGRKSKWIQLKEFSWFYFISICKLPSFWAIIICGMIIILINSVNLGTVYGVDSYPATYFIVEELQETSIYFFVILLLFYSGELIWKERSVKLNLIYDATPMSSFINLLGKFFGLLMIYIVLIIALIASGLIFQTLSGYYQYDIEVYFYGFFLEILPFLALYTLLAFVIQSIINNKFVGIFIVLIFFILTVVSGFFGFNHPLYLFGGGSLGTYSEMNGYGHFLKPYLVVKFYWLLFGILLLVIGSLFIVRGTETNLKKRFRASKFRMSKPLFKLSGLIAMSFIIVGVYIFYNTNILNEYWSNSDTIQYRVSYEDELKQFEYFPQPKIIDVNLTVDLYPSKRQYIAEGYYILKNTTNASINEVHIQKLIENYVSLDNVEFEGGAKINNTYKKFDYTIYRLNKTLEPNHTVRMNFKQSFIPKGFELSGSDISIIENGIFFKNQDLPTLGYNRKYELHDNDERVEYQLANRANKAEINDEKELVNARSGSDSDGINFEIILSTDDDQTAIAPGNLLKTWQVDHRNYFHYKTDQPIMNFYSIVSARYEIKKDTWKIKSDAIVNEVDMEIYYHKSHDYNLDRMMNSMKASLDYYSTNFSPYQYQHIRIMEFPRYAEFAQSFPGTVPFSEAIGFVLDIDDEEDVDMSFFVTAHELAHQWFGMQVGAANVKGQHFILETLSQYAALMVLKHYYSEEKVNQFLELQNEIYLKERQRETGVEPSLALVEHQDYIYYAKGAINMYELQKHIGEANVNRALKLFIQDWNTKDGKLKLQTNRYPTSKDLIQYFKKVSSNDKVYIIDELFNTVD